MKNQEKQKLVNLLNQLLADTVIYKRKVQAYHWNVTGLFFKQFHDLFQDIYEDLEEAIDDIAEQIRILGEYPDVAPSTYVEKSFLEEPKSTPKMKASEMVLSLQEDNERIQNLIRVIQKVADEVEGISDDHSDGEAVLDFVVERQREHDEIRYILKSHIE